MCHVRGENQDDKVDFKIQRKYTDVANVRLKLQNKVTSPASRWSQGVISTYHSSTSCWLPNFFCKDHLICSRRYSLQHNKWHFCKHTKNTNVPPLFSPGFLSKHVNLYACGDEACHYCCHFSEGEAGCKRNWGLLSRWVADLEPYGFQLLFLCSFHKTMCLPEDNVVTNDVQIKFALRGLPHLCASDDAEEILWGLRGETVGNSRCLLNMNICLIVSYLHPYTLECISQIHCSSNLKVNYNVI